MSAANKLVPELRFPEFLGDGEWEAFTVDELFKSLATRNHQVPSSAICTSGNYPVVDQGKAIVAGYSDCRERLFKKVPVIVFGDHTTVTKFIAFEFIVGADGIKILQKKRSQDSIHFLFHSLECFKMAQEVYKRHFSILRSVAIPLPTSPAEQQKIADCLGSLDALLAAHSRKLAALQDHKKGLLQQLFPAEGETTPKRRFLGFEGEWDATSLGVACLMKAGKFVKASEIREQTEDKLYPCFGGNGLRGYTSTYTHDGDYPLIGRQGALCGNVQLASGRFHATEHAVVADPRKNVKTDWIFYALILLNLNQYATGQAQPGLSVDVLNRVPLAIPTLSEQQKIADCLSALDVTITAQTGKIAALKEHKKGLMQKLFPSETK